MKSVVLCLLVSTVVSGSDIINLLACNNNTACGVQHYHPHTPPTTGATTYIIGGREAVPHSWPWQALLKFRTSTITCGGTLIRGCNGELVVITTAHCVDGTVAADWTVDTGVHSRSANEASQKSYAVREIIPHESFNPSYLLNDIAILKLATHVSESFEVQPVCVSTLPTSDFFGKQCVISGWGTTAEGGSPADKLQEVYVPVLTDADCSQNIGGAFEPSYMLCAGDLLGGKGACQGDVGGPLACKNVNGQWDLIGIVSWGFGCARPGFPAVYARVHNYLDWISTKTSAAQ